MRVSIDTAVLRALAAPRRRFAADGARRLWLAGGQVGTLERHAQLEKLRVCCIGAIGSNDLCDLHSRNGFYIRSVSMR